MFYVPCYSAPNLHLNEIYKPLNIRFIYIIQRNLFFLLLYNLLQILLNENPILTLHNTQQRLSENECVKLECLGVGAENVASIQKPTKTMEYNTQGRLSAFLLNY